ncbi:MAG TPA: acyltransferase family protein [Edaphocola sp.]|nr:acyltransferase family protein [Edaphocola sp.]
MNHKQGLFSKSDTTYFKGIGILLIFIHNYFHLKGTYNIQNEIAFKPDNIWAFFNLFTKFNITDWIGGIFGFLGHYGVQIFIFFSAYGLSIQYSKWEQSKIKFVIKRLKKIYLLLAFGIVYWLISKPFIGAVDNFNGFVMQSIYLATSIGNITRATVYSMFSGPFWFFALVIQLYVLFPLIYRYTIEISKTSKWLPLGGVLALLYLLYFTINLHKYALFGTVIGHLPEVILGVTMAHFKIKSFSPPILIAATLIFIGSQFLEVLFPLSFISMTILLIHIVSFLEQKSSLNLKKFILFTGTISMMLFIFNGTLRFYPLFMEDGKIQIFRFLIFVPILYVISYPSYLLFNYLSRLLFQRSSKNK